MGYTIAASAGEDSDVSDLTIGRADLTDSGWFGPSLAPGDVLPENQSGESVRIPGRLRVSPSVGVRTRVVKVDGAVACARASTRR